MALREGRCRVCGAKGPLTPKGAVRTHTGKDGYGRCLGSGRKPAPAGGGVEGRGPVTPGRLSGLRIEALGMAASWKPQHEREGMLANYDEVRYWIVDVATSRVACQGVRRPKREESGFFGPHGPYGPYGPRRSW